MHPAITYSKQKLTKKEANLIFDFFETLNKSIPDEGCYIVTIFHINYCRNSRIEDDLMKQAARFGELFFNSWDGLHLRDISRGKFIKIERTKEEN